NSPQMDPLLETILSCGCVMTARRFSNDPVEQSSISVTDLPSARRRSTRCDPIKPAPPVTRMCSALAIRGPGLLDGRGRFAGSVGNRQCAGDGPGEHLAVLRLCDQCGFVRARKI